MASSTSPSRKEQHNQHPSPIKTSHTGLLTRSNSSKVHGSWAKHHYTPVPPSPSAFVFDPPESSPDRTRRHTRPLPHVQTSPSGKSHKYESPRGSEKSSSMSPSPSKHSRSWAGRNSEGEQVNLPRHPYLWTPAQLAMYLSSELYGIDGEPLNSDVVNTMVDFIQQRKIGGRAFLNLDQEDFQEMEGVDSLWSNALWDASSTLRRGIAPYRPSRISSSAYKRGRVRGVVNLFERSASESSDVGEEEAHNKSPGKGLPTGVPPVHKHRRKTPTQKRDISESEDELNHLDIDLSQHTRLQRNATPGDDSEAPLPREPYMDIGTSTVHNDVHGINPQNSLSAHVALDLNERPIPPHVSGIVVDDNLAVVIPPHSGTPVDLVLGPDEFQYRAADSPEPPLPDDHTLLCNREVEIIPIHPREISEPTVAELYEQTYGALPSSSRGEHPVPQIPSDEEIFGETVKIVVAATSSDPPPTALRPIVQRRAASPPPSLRRLFVPSEVLQPASNTEPQSVYILPASGSEWDEAAVRTLSALKERLAIIERRLEAMELKDAEAKSFKDQASHCSRVSKRMSLPIKEDLHDLDLAVHTSRSAETLRTWQSAYILLAGATTGVSMVLIPMLLRHLWSR